MQITTSKNEQNRSALFRDIGDLLFHRILGMWDHIQLK